MAKKDKKGKKDDSNEPPESDVQDEILLATTNLEPEPEEVQYTDTSYTSASFESLPPVIEEPKAKKKKGKKKIEAVEVLKDTSELFQWSEESLPAEEQKIEEEQKETKKKKSKKGKKEKEKEEIPEFEKVNL
ncbi:uncharacterized protein LOC131842322 [Achroia grisella]|uniref:uncharacterized protein LOC131842322 n=1 Tax=Achroia grisella TaxID=688607 RepID=UPI0027D325E4|nr:uncharacterized protein LOC131842322 [Achroia grisella]